MVAYSRTANRLVLVHDESSFFCYACGADGAAFAAEVFPGGSWFSPPAEVFNWAKKQAVQEVLLLGEFAVGRLRFSIPAGLEDFEIEKSLGFEYAAINNESGGSIRAAAADDLFTGNEQRIIIFGLQENDLATLRKTCADAGMTFLGVAPVGLIWMLALANSSEGGMPQEVFWYIGRRRSLLCVPNLKAKGHELRSVAVGTAHIQSGEWQNKLARYLDSTKKCAVNVLSCIELPEAFREFSNTHQVVEQDRLEARQELAEYCAGAQTSVYSTVCPLVRFAQPSTGKFHYGHFVALLMLALTAVLAGAVWLYYSHEISVLAANVKRAEALTEAKKGLEQDTAKIVAERVKQDQIISLISRNERVDDKIIQILRSVCDSIPPGICLRTVSKDLEGIKISGDYLIQADMANFGFKLQSYLEKYDFRVQPLQAGVMKTKKLDTKREVVENKGDFILLVK